MLKTNKTNQKGIVHLVLLVLVLLAAVAAIVGVIIFKPNLGSVVGKDKPQKEEVMVQASPTVTTVETSSLEKEVDSQQLSDPSTDFSDVDKDINSL